MRICASLGSADEIRSKDIETADMIEIRTDIFGTVPPSVLREGQKGLITFGNGIDTDMIPGPEWIADIGNGEYPNVTNEIVSFHHDFRGTPENAESVLNNMCGDIVKGAFTVNSVADNVKLFEASRKVKKRHVIIGMGELGKITRVRSNILNNEFTFASAGKGTAPGQMSISEMRWIGDDSMITGIAGCGIGYTRSPAMHSAAFRYSSVRGMYLVFDTPSIDRIGEMIIDYQIRGINVTMPYKTSIADQLDSVDDVSKATGAVNTVVSDNGKLRGYNTDVYGIEMSMKASDLKGKRALILGSGGAARSCAYFLSSIGCGVTVTGRNASAVSGMSSDMGVNAAERTSVAVNMYDIIINCTPLNAFSDISEYPVDIRRIDRSQTVFDMVYGTTRLTETAIAKGCTVIRGEEMLAHQGVRSFELFASKRIPYKVMRDAV